MQNVKCRIQILKPTVVINPFRHFALCIIHIAFASLRHKRLNDRNLMHLPAIGLVAADANFDPPERHRIRRRRFALADVIDNPIAIVVKTVGALIGTIFGISHRSIRQVILIKAVVFVVV